MERLVNKYIFDPEMNAGKMIFLTGPRQVGKTTFARNWLAAKGHADGYFNWDDPAVSKEYKRNPLYFKNLIDAKFDRKPVPIVFDEIHKQKNWKNILKGIYDANKGKMILLVTGSARLGWYRKSGDSLVGRYFSYQMLPLGLPEAINNFKHVLMNDEPLHDINALANITRKINISDSHDSLSHLLSYGGFPEPFLKDSPRFHKRWQSEYRTLLTKEDIRDLSRISDIKGIEQLMEILPTKVGSPLSINSIKEDVGSHHATISHWIDILKAIYLVFTIRPWHKNIVRSIKKEAKLYFYDWSCITNTGSRFENLLAVNLIKLAARFTETGLGTFEVMYIKDKDKREIDFVLVKDNKPAALFEAKETDCEIGKTAIYFSKHLGIPYYQIVRDCRKIEVFPGNCAVIPAHIFLLLTG